MTWPPAASHSAALFLVTQPCPLHWFSPLHSWVAVLHSDSPLQPLTPAHFTAPSCAAKAVVAAAPAASSVKAATAATAPKSLRFMILPPGLWGCGDETPGETGTLRAMRAALATLAAGR